MPVWLCHEASDACTGVVRKHEEQEEDQQLTDEAIARLLKDNAGKVKRPVVAFNPADGEPRVVKTIKTGNPSKSNINTGSNIHVEL